MKRCPNDESRRWTDIVSFTINMEQIGDAIERALQDVEDKKIRKNRRFSDAGMSRDLPVFMKGF